MAQIKLIVAAAIIGAFALVSGGVTAEATDTDARSYRITLINLTEGQPFSPPVAITHRNNVSLFQVGGFASDEVAAIAQGGDEVPAANAFTGRQGVTSVVDVGVPLTPFGKQVGTFTFVSQFNIAANRGDRLSLATMLICTNDGFTGLDSVRLPNHGTRAFLANGYDAGRELNTEVSKDLVDPCSGLGPVKLPGDPNGNDDTSVRNNPAGRIAHHAGIAGGGDLDPDVHGWDDPVLLVIVQRID